MSFTIRPDEGISKAIRRVARAQLGKAADTLRDGGQPLCQRIHLMRTSIKRVRALIALARPAAPHGARRADRRLRRLAGATSELRDAEVVLMTLDGVWPAPTGIRKDTALTCIRAELVARLSTVERTFETEKTIERLIKRLLRERHRTREWVPANKKSGWDGWEKLWNRPAARVSKSYRRARRAMARASRDGGTEAFHDWRKSVKRHRYHLQFLHGAPSDESIAKLAGLEELGELLGEEHDLAVLEATVANDAKALPGGADRDRLSAAITKRRRALEAKAGPLGERLFGMRPRAFRGRLQSRLRQEHQDRSRVHGSGHGHPHPQGQTDTLADPGDRRSSAAHAAPSPVVMPSARQRLTLV